jgi:hypothetical protein
MSRRKKNFLKNSQKKKSLKTRKRLRKLNYSRKSREWKRNFLLVTKQWTMQ